MKNEKRMTAIRTRRINRVRAKVKGTETRPRLTVKRTLSHIYAQIIDDVSGCTLVAASDGEIKEKKIKKTEIAALVGKLIAGKAKEKKITQVVFDRRDKKYHGRVKALAEGARSEGLKF